MRVPSVLLIVFVAGCVQPPAPPLSAQDSSVPAPEPEQPADVAAPQHYALAVHHLNYRGKTETEICPGIASLEECLVASSGEEDLRRLPPVPRPVRLNGTIVWDSNIGGGALAAVLDRWENGTWRSQWASGYVAVSMQDLQFAWDLSPLPASAELRLRVMHGRDHHAPPVPVFLWIAWEAEFQVDAYLSALA
jgi:hypothetical protein